MVDRIEEAHRRVMAAWRGNVDEETMAEDIRVGFLAAHDAACRGCQYFIKYPDFTSAQTELGRSRCKERTHIEALGKAAV